MKLQFIGIAAVILLLGCTSPIIQENVSVTGEGFDFEILAFPGLEHVGVTDNYETFYARDDASFSIYVEKSIYSAESFDSAKMIFSESFGYYENFECAEVYQNDWLTNAQILECFYESTELNTSYKSTIFYKNNEFIHSMLSVWGLNLNTYEGLFDEFNKEAIKWE